MNSEARQFEQRHFIEDVALFYEHEGLPRMAGRILGWLLICDPPHQSPDELAEVLQASKGSISTMTRLLIQMDLVERIGLPGQRRDYFRLKPGGWSQMIRQEAFKASTMRQLAERGRGLLENQEPELGKRLEELCCLYAFLAKEYTALFERWERKCQAATRKRR